MKIWFKIWENTHLLKSETIEDDTEDTRTHKIFHALEEVCLKWDLGKPIWFDANIAEFQMHARTRFGKDNFVEDEDDDKENDNEEAEFNAKLAEALGTHRAHSAKPTPSNASPSVQSPPSHQTDAQHPLTIGFADQIGRAHV